MIRIQQGWDAQSRLVTRTDDLGNVTRTTYDDLGRAVRLDHADGTHETWSYDADSNLMTHVAQDGVPDNWEVDAEGRALRVTVGAGGLVPPVSVSRLAE